MRDPVRAAVHFWLATLSPLQRSRLREALASHDVRLVQRVNTDPPPIHALRSHRCYAACLVGFVQLDAQPESTTEQVEDYIMATAVAIEPWRFALIAEEWDGTLEKPRPYREAFAAMLAEVEAFERDTDVA